MDSLAKENLRHLQGGPSGAYIPATILSPKPAAVPIRWIDHGETIDIKGFKIAGGMIYTGTIAGQNAGGREFAPVIDPAALVDTRSSDIAGTALNYWPAYSQIHPRNRRAYLEWLAAGRRDPRFGIGYVFLFFYGLERRIFFDRALTDASAILQEVEALKAVYGSHVSFRSYAERFTAALRIASAGVAGEPPPFALRQDYLDELPLDLRFSLGRRLSEGRLSGDWLLAWYLGHPETRLKTPGNRCFGEFCRLFQVRFAARYPKGLTVRLPAKRLKLTYKPASGTPAVIVPGIHEEWPDPGALSAPLKVAQGLADNCTEALGPFSRYIGRYPSAKDSAQAQLLLPPELVDGSASPIRKLKYELDALIPSGAGQLAISKLLELAGLAADQKPNNAALKTLSRLLAVAGLGLEPDPSASNSQATDSSVVLFKAPGGAPVDRERPAYTAARALVEAGAIAAAIAGKNAYAGFKIVWMDVERLPGLSDAERVRLFAFLTSLYGFVPNQNRLLKRLPACSTAEGELIARTVMRTIGAVPAVEVAQIAFAEKLYMALGLPKEQVYSDLQELSVPKTRHLHDDLPVVAPAMAGVPGVPIPPHPPAGLLTPSGIAARGKPGAELTLHGGDGGLSGHDGAHGAYDLEPVASGAPILDFTKLDRKRRETEEASGLLNRLFAEADSEMVFVNEMLTVPLAHADGRFPGLEREYAEIVDLFLKRDGQVGRVEFDAFAGALVAFPDGALEAINDWAYAQFNEPLIDEGELLTIPAHLLKQLKELA